MFCSLSLPQLPLLQFLQVCLNHHHGLHLGGVEAVPGRGDQAPGQVERPLAAAAGHGHCHDYTGEVGEQGELLLVHPPPGEQVGGGGQRLVHQALLLEVVQGGGPWRSPWPPR